METMETVRAILDAEKEAARLCADAESLRSGKDERIQKGMDVITLKYADETSAAIALAEKNEKERADSELARIETETKAHIEALREKFSVSRDEYADKLFNIVIGEADDKG